MLVTFTCKAYADITFFGDIAKRLLKIMGYSQTEQGVIRANDIPDVLLRLKSGIQVSNAPASSDLSKYSREDADETPISLAHRALPLIELLNAAQQEKCDVMWDTK